MVFATVEKMTSFVSFGFKNVTVFFHENHIVSDVKISIKNDVTLMQLLQSEGRTVTIDFI